MSDATQDNTKKAVEDLLRTLGIKRVVCVDDIYDEIPLDEVLTAQTKLQPEIFKEVLPELASTLNSDEEIRRNQIRDCFEKLEKPRQKEVSSKILSLVNDGKKDSLHASELKEFFGKDILLELTPGDWGKQKEKLLEDAKSIPTLFLFDQDFSRSSGGSKTAGTTIISGIQKDGRGDILCGLLTGTIKVHEQMQAWEDLARENSLDQDRFLVIPKETLESAALGFARMLKLIALGPDFKKLKAAAANIIKQAHEKAVEKVAKITIGDFDHMVFQIPTKEGVWEPEILFRIFSLFQNAESKQLAHQGTEMEDTVQRIRSVSHVPLKLEIKPTKCVWDIQQQELYESGEYLNQFHLPIEIGDIFEKTSGEGKKHYILISQPCDLMVRDGRRTNEPEYFSLLEICPDDGKSKNPSFVEEMPYYGKYGEGKFFLKFKNVHYVRPEVLDLCVFDQQGHARFDFKTEVPAGIRPAWKKRFSEIKKIFKKCAERQRALTPSGEAAAGVKKYLENAQKILDMKTLNSGPFKGKISSNDDRIFVEYDFKRSRRLSMDRATATLINFGRCLSRPGFDVSLLDEKCFEAEKPSI